MVARLLYLLNVSNPDRLSADSGWRLAATLAPAWADRGVRVTFCSPAPLPDPRVRFVASASPASKYRARFDHDSAVVADLIRKADPDIVVVNQIEQAAGVRAALLETGSAATLAGYCHYLPFHVDGDRLHGDPSLGDAGLGRPVLLHFVAGLLACDRVLVHSVTARDWVVRAAVACGMPAPARIEIVPPARDPELVRAPDGERRSTGTGVYNHRLYAHYGTARLVDLVRRITTGTPVRIQVTDLFGARRPGRTALDASPERYRAALAAIPGVRVVSDGGSRARYRSLLTGADFAIAPFRPGCPWSMSVIDCQALGIPVIAPRMGWMSEHIDPELLFDDAEDGVKIAQRLVEDPLFRAEQARRAHQSTASLDVGLIAGRYLAAVS
ncbi:glycosyltransferase [Micromonospora sp. KC723]|uniref:glycosyltransferase n=1 Tax=Micromonospora sp. KC723 TaxID=2530381 RepID=UPI001043472C|nr:glycosyltransferase [Micromonospora sp. KC723]TDB78261.1 glycosyltransferase family 1 protein [Micromonospora sp. KC723]